MLKNLILCRFLSEVFLRIFHYDFLVKCVRFIDNFDKVRYSYYQEKLPTSSKVYKRGGHFGNLNDSSEFGVINIFCISRIFNHLHSTSFCDSGGIRKWS